jgi:putative redox protein
MQEGQVRFPGAGGAEARGVLELPHGGAPVAFAVLAECFASAGSPATAAVLARALTRRRLGVLRVYGPGGAEGPGAGGCGPSAEDLVAAAEWLAAEHGAPRLLVGHSLAGVAVLYAAREMASVAAVATIGVPASVPDVRGLEAYAEEIDRTSAAELDLGGGPVVITSAFFEGLAGDRLTSVVGGIGRPLLIMHAAEDAVVRAAAADALYAAAARPKSVLALAGADHGLSHRRDAARAASLLAAWAEHHVVEDAVDRTVERQQSGRVTARIGSSGYTTEIVAGGHGLLADEPDSVGGADLGPTPYDLVAAGLGACTAMTLRMYADRKGWPLEDVRVELWHDRIHAEDEKNCETGRAKLDAIHREIALTGALDESQRTRLLEIANRCPVHQTLDAGVVVTSSLAAEPGTVE